MALVFNTKAGIRVASVATSERITAAGVKASDGAMIDGVIDISSNLAAGVVITAGQLGLKVIDGIILQAAELEKIKITYTLQANGVSVTITSQTIIDNTPVDVANDANVGEIAFHAWGQRTGTTEN